MGWFSEEIVTNNAVSTEEKPETAHILSTIAVVSLAAVVITYVIAKLCNKILTSRMQTAARREIETNRLNNATVRNV